MAYKYKKCKISSIKYNDEFREKHEIDDYLYSNSFHKLSPEESPYKNDKNYLYVQYYFKSGLGSYQHQTGFSYEEYLDLVEFMKDPELYKSVKNYNL